jgi:hypothetical protein
MQSPSSEPRRPTRSTSPHSQGIRTGRGNAPDAASAAASSRGARLLYVCWFLLGTGFAGVLGFAVATVVMNGHAPQTTDAREQPVAENTESASSKKPPRKEDDLELDPPPSLDEPAPEDRLVRADDPKRILGGSFTTKPASDPLLPASGAPPLLPPTFQLPELPKLTPDELKLPKAGQDEPKLPKVTHDEPTPPTPPVKKNDPPPRPPVKKNDPPPKPASVNADAAVKKRLHASEEHLRKQLLTIPELRLFSDLEIEAFRQDANTTSSSPIQRIGQLSPLFLADVRLNQAMLRAGAKAGLPLNTGPSSRMDVPTATIVQTLSKNLRSMGFVSVPGTPTRVINFPGTVGVGVGQPATIDNASAEDKTHAFKAWCDSNKVEKFRGGLATLLQMLQVEHVPTRLILVRELARVNNAGGTAALTKRALVDLSAEVREAALFALEKRPAGQYVPVLLQGLRYPWPPVADRAALALRKLKPEGVVPKLVDLLDQPDPSVPVLNASKKPVVRELVRLNHMRNCLLCHAPSADSKDGLVRGLVPTPGQPVPVLYYEGQSGNYARADTTFLRQDFSVNLPVEAAAPWPNEQRFDFVTRVRPATRDELTKTTAKPGNYPQRDAVLYALRGLTGKDGGDSSDKWREMLDIAQDKSSKAKDEPLDKPNPSSKDKTEALDR